MGTPLEQQVGSSGRFERREQCHLEFGGCGADERERRVRDSRSTRRYFDFSYFFAAAFHHVTGFTTPASASTSTVTCTGRVALASYSVPDTNDDGTP